uniref:UPF0729 protein n=1 Tax=Panagrellus redivivus TaxID=6233 RepID=A0A7E4UVW2_PANRE
MVCVPCIILPVLLAIYVRFIQPIVLRYVPDQWKNWLDNLLYPTCALPRRPVPETPKDGPLDADRDVSHIRQGEDVDATLEDDCCAAVATNDTSEAKKDN